MGKITTFESWVDKVKMGIILDEFTIISLKFLLGIRMTKKTTYPFGYNVWPITSAFHIFFFFLRIALTEFQWVSCTIHGTHKPLFSTKLSLKMDLTALFTHLKIILLPSLQFSIFSGIQTDLTKTTEAE